MHAACLQLFCQTPVVKFVEVGLDQIPLNGGLNVRLHDLNIALFNVSGRIFAVEGDCIRCASLLASGAVDGLEVTCPGCGWPYDVTTGHVRHVPKLRIDTYTVEVAGARVMVLDPFV